MQTQQLPTQTDFNEYVNCAKSSAHFAVKHCKTMDVETNEIKLFPDFPYLKEFFIQNLIPKNEHIEKSRQMMISWAFMALFLHDISFKDNVADFITSRKEDLVDDGGVNSTVNSLFGRIRFIWESLPDYLKAPLEFSHLKIKNNMRNSFILGESSNPNAGRSGTWYRSLMDEAAHIPKSETVFASLFQACKKGCYMNSTPFGRGGVFARIKFDQETTFRKRTLHWKMHPDRDKRWYDEQCKDMTQDEIARELDISYEKSVAGQIWHMFDFATQIGDYPYDENLPLYRGWDFGIGNPTAILWIQERPVPNQLYPEIRIIHELERSGESPPFYAKYVHDRPYRQDADDYGDPAGRQTEINLKSWVSWLAEYGIKIRVKYRQRKLDTILAGQRIAPYVRIDKSCVRIQECISNYKHPTDDEGHIMGDTYEENWATHLMKAFEYYAVNKYPIKKTVFRAI